MRVQNHDCDDGISDGLLRDILLALLQEHTLAAVVNTLSSICLVEASWRAEDEDKWNSIGVRVEASWGAEDEDKWNSIGVTLLNIFGGGK